MLEAAFVAWLVALLGDTAVRGVPRLLLGNRGRREFTAALSAASSVAIAAVLQDVPPQSRDVLERALRECFASPPAAVLDGRTRVRVALTGAVGEQIAPLADPGITTSGVSFLEEIGIDAARLCDDIADIVIRSIEQVGPNFPVLMPLVTQLNADGIFELGGNTDAKVDEILARIERWKQDLPPIPHSDGDHSAGHAVQPFQFPPDASDRLADALLEVPSIADGETRNAILNMLPIPVRDSIPRSHVPRIQVYYIVQACPRYAHGLRDLVKIIRSFERDSLPMRHLDTVILEIGQAGGSCAGEIRAGG